MIRRVLISLLVVLSVGAVLRMPPAWGLDLDGARTQGLVGERADGLIGSVVTSADVTALVQSVNATRLNDYRGIAQRQGTKLEAVQAVVGEQLIAKARMNGWYYMDAGGTWKKG